MPPCSETRSPRAMLVRFLDQRCSQHRSGRSHDRAGADDHRFYSEPRLLSVTVALSVGFIFGSLSAQYAALVRRQMRFGLLTAVQLTSFVVAVTAAIAVAAIGGNN